MRSGLARARTVAAGRAGRMAGAARARAARPAGQCRARPSASDMLAAVRRRRADAAQPVGHAPAARHAGSTIIRPSPTGLVEVQDEGSQLIALACEPAKAQRSPRPVRRGRAARRWRWRRPRPRRRSSRPTATARGLSKLGPRAERAGASIETRLLDARRANSTSWPTGEGRPTSCWSMRRARGSGTWRRNPEGRWRLTPERLDRLVALQARLLDLAAELVTPGRAAGLCGLLDPVPRRGRPDRGLLSRRSSWIVQETPIDAGRSDGAGRLLTPAHDGTDGFFVARLVRPC